MRLIPATKHDRSNIQNTGEFSYTSKSSSPIFLSSGNEDYFLSASYFDEGMFKVTLVIPIILRPKTKKSEL